MSAQQVNDLLTAVERWYRRHARELPWRTPPGAKRGQDPYLIWLSEVMLQQTTIPHAAAYFSKFRERWPTVDKLARARWEDVSAAWAGLGYYSRARSLHAAAKEVAAAGGFPQDRAGLIELPGVGPYTAAAVAAIAFGEKAAPVDGNIERVVSRVRAIGSDGTEAGWRASKKLIAAEAQRWFDALSAKQSAGDLAQALMDIGATICTPRKPACVLCPLSEFCAARKKNEQERYPVKPEKRAQPVRHGSAFVAVKGDKLKGVRVLLVRRPPKGLLGGMWMPPTGDWAEKNDDPMHGAPAGLIWDSVGEIRHVFTHFALRLTVYRAVAKQSFRRPEQYAWVEREEALSSLPTVGRKAVRLALDAA